MSELGTKAGAEIHDLVEAGRQKLAEAKGGANDGLQLASDYIRSNPWTAVGIAAAAGLVISVLANRPKPRNQNIKAVREWLEDAYAKIPSEKQVRSAVDASGAPSFLKELGRKLHLG